MEGKPPFFIVLNLFYFLLFGMDPDSEALLALLEGNPGGLTQKDLLDLGWEKQKLLLAANVLKQRRRLEVTPKDGQIVFKAVAADMAMKFEGLTEEHRTLYKLIKEAGDTGIWTKDLQKKAGMATANLTRLAKMLESRRLIKQVSPVQSKSRKVWMLYELEPSSEISGGSWYKDGSIDTNLVESLRESVYEYVANCGSRPATVEDIHKYLSSQGESTRSIEDVANVVLTLELDNRLAHQRSSTGLSAYTIRSQANLSLVYELESIPCLSCPVSNRCTPGAAVAPESCTYLAKWLQLGDNLDF